MSVEAGHYPHDEAENRTARAGSAAFLTAATVATAYWLYQCWAVASHGHAASATASRAIAWGITVANIIHLIGISHVGIAISAGVRVLNLRRYRNVARLAELVTITALVAAVANIALDVGRPDRFLIGLLRHGNITAPMVWSMTVISLYLMASAVYLYLSVRRDLWVLSTRAARFRKLYALLALGYVDTGLSRFRHERTLYWLALALIPIMVSVHSVYGWMFGVLESKPGWYNPLQAPYFVLGAVVSGFSAIVVVGALVRSAFGWSRLLDERAFKGLGGFLAFVGFLYLYFMASEHLTAQYATLPAERAASDLLLFGRLSRSFWTMTSAGLVLPCLYLLVQTVRQAPARVGRTAVAALLINVAMWWKRYLMVIAGQSVRALPLPLPVEHYSPGFQEIVLTVGSYAFAALLFRCLLLIVPGVPLAVPPALVGTVSARRAALRLTAASIALVAGVVLIAWGLAVPAAGFAPLKWIAGIASLVCIPLCICLVPDATAALAEGNKPGY